MKYLANIIIYPMALMCRLSRIIFSIEYKESLYNLFDTKRKHSKVLVIILILTGIAFALNVIYKIIIAWIQ